MIRAVTFDFWNTLYSEQPGTEPRRLDGRVTTVESFFAAAGRTLDGRQVREAIVELAKSIRHIRRHEQRALSHGEVGQFVGRRLGFDLSDREGETLAELMSQAGLNCPPEPADWAGHLLSRLHGKVRLAVVSDTSLTFGMHLRQVMDTHGLGHYFDHFTWSDETLTTKPTERQYLYTLAMLNVLPAEAVHVGDLERRDVQGAHSVGMRCIRVLGASRQRGSAAEATVEDLSGVLEVLRQWGVDV